MKKKEQKITKHDAEELMAFRALLAYRDTSADLMDVYRRLAERHRMYYGEDMAT